MTIRPIPKMGRNAVDTNELFIDDLFVADEDVIGEVGGGFRAILGRAQRRAGHLRERGGRHRRGGAAPGHRVRQGARGLRPADRAEPGPRVPARPGADPARRGRHAAAEGGLAGRPTACPAAREANAAKYLVRRGRLLRRRRRDPGARRLRLRQGVPRRALLPRGAADAARADQPGDGAQLRRPSTCSACRGATDGRAGVPLASSSSRATSRAWVDKALAAGADAVVLDLEDSVPAGVKDAARGDGAGVDRRRARATPDVGLFVRVNAAGHPADRRATWRRWSCPGLTGCSCRRSSTATDVLR